MAAIFDISRHFNPEHIEKLQRVAEQLAPHAEEIINSWVDKQRSFEVAPIIPREKLLSLFTTLFYGTLDALMTGNISQYLSIQLPIIGRSLVESGFPYEHLVITVHFLEESYFPFLVEPGPDRKVDMDAYMTVDKFWHFWIAGLVYSYFYEFKRTLTEEVEIGRAIQESMRSRIPSSIGCLQIGSLYHSATIGAKVGGDIYDAVDLGDATQYIILSDFSGKGLRAAVKAANVKAMFRGFAIEEGSPVLVAERLNRILANELTAEEFDTAFIARFDQKDKSMRYVNAGHPAPVLIGGNGEVFTLSEGDNIALGMFEDATFSDGSVALQQGAVLVIFTDGVIEARRDKRMFGTEGVIDSARRNFAGKASDIAEAIWADCLSFAEGKIEDDVAILALRCT